MERTNRSQCALAWGLCGGQAGLMASGVAAHYILNRDKLNGGSDTHAIGKTWAGFMSQEPQPSRLLGLYVCLSTFLLLCRIGEGMQGHDPIFLYYAFTAHSHFVVDS
jgi:hypothetical protein